MYEYEPLDRERKEIRLLTLQPGSGNAMLFCTLATAYLDTSTSPHYETISYVCGDQKIKAPINLHGSEVEVPATSEAALRRMRREDRPRTLWIDAICINEADVDERSHQVGIMYEIYTHTRHNCIYLGPDDGSMPKVIKSMESMLREISAETRDYVDFNETLDTLGRNKSLDAPLSIDINRSGLLQFFENPWFSRLWVVQEASLGHISTCYCGVFYISLTDVLHVGRWLFHKSDQLPGLTTAQILGTSNAVSIFNAADRTYGRFFRYRPLLWNFLVAFADFHTFDRKDQLLALVALWQMHTRTPVLPAILKPDYTLGVSEVFRHA